MIGALLLIPCLLRVLTRPGSSDAPGGNGQP